ncbi:MAG: Gfo/Idh/MocA family oxidoreductase [Lentisphaerae bacterium]|nr:Gfo/Idh/MocA family oxidoreductase [Lentisphaerota bacterium]MCP4102510.1 Gfo/Idh/MocA family oxidoreductase [Lentisphaerota bacterium]
MSAENKQINVAIIGAGSRGKGVVGNLLRDSDGIVKVVSLFDPDKEVAESAAKHWNTLEATICDSYMGAINTAGVEWVMVFSPNTYHKEHILAAFNAGKHVFSEPPLATSIEDCEEIYQAHQKNNLIFATGFVLRYAPIYRKVKDVLDSGVVGKILSIDANENITPDHGGYIMRNWRRFSKYAGPHILEKCCHDLDLINWFCQSVPSKIASFGSRDFFIPENDGYREEFGAKTFASWDDPHAVESPFTSDKDLMDNQVGIMQYRNGIKVMFQATMSNVIPERRMYFSCSEGNMVVELYSSVVRYRRIGDEGETVINFGADGHGGGDSYIMRELYDCMANGTDPKCSGDEGLESAVVAIALDKAANTNEIVDLDPVWIRLNR